MSPRQRVLSLGVLICIAALCSLLEQTPAVQAQPAEKSLECDNSACMPPGGDEICSGRGECECGVCKCISTEEGKYSGKYCQRCPTCSGRCNELKECVMCQMYKAGPLKAVDDCATNCTTFVAIPEKKIIIDESKDELLCIFYDENDCKYFFKYSEVADKIVVHAQDELQCPSKWNWNWLRMKW